MIDKNKIEYFFFSFFANLVSFGGLKSSQKWGGFFGYLFYYIIPIRKAVVTDNFRRAFPEKSEIEIRNLVKRNYISVGKTFAEMMVIQKSSAEELLSRTEWDRNAVDQVKEIISNKEGVVFLTAHFGNWELGANITALLTNEQIAVLVKPQRNPYVTEWMTKIRTKFGNVEITLGTSVKELFYELKNGRTVGIVGDQRGPSEGKRINFFGQQTSIYTGAAAIAQKLGSKILIVFIFRTGNAKYKITFEELDYSSFNGTNEEITLQITQTYMNKLESIIRQYPDQWFWMHNIWKY